VASTGLGPRFIAFLKARPILCLAILTPGIPEYLSTSSSLLTIAVNPAFFVLQLAINVAQYTAGALLVREALLRWRKGWATGIALGLAYGVAEEGLGDNTLFNSTHGTDGVLGLYGHFLGVNWVWATGVLAFHVIYSTGLPIVLLGLALPHTRGRSLLGRRSVAAALTSVSAAAAVEMTLVWGVDRFWLGWPLLIGSLVTIAGLVAFGYWAPAGAAGPRRDFPSLTPGVAFAIGLGFFPIAFLLEYGGALVLPAAATIGVELVAFGLLLEAVRRGIGRRGNEFLWVQLAFGFVLWQGLFGWLVTFGLPYVLVLLGVAVYFFVRLRRAYAPGPPPLSPPRRDAGSPGASGGP
jgi:hypothetical protein